MKKLLFANACVNRATSRTQRISEALISLLQKNDDFDVIELVLEDKNIPVLTSETLNKRLALSDNDEFSNGVFNYSNQFKDVDCVVIAAPYWDFEFPAMLKAYIEAISVPGIVYRFTEDGRPIGLCKAEKIYYVTTRGGCIGDKNDLGYATMVQLGGYYGIEEVKCISMDGLDIPINDTEGLISTAIADLSNKLLDTGNF